MVALLSLAGAYTSVTSVSSSELSWCLYKLFFFLTNTVAFLARAARACAPILHVRLPSGVARALNSF